MSPWTDLLERARRRAAESALEAAAGSPFYADRYRGVVRPGTEPLSELLRELPILTKAELRAEQEAHPPWGRASLADPADVIQVQQSSGTSGRPLYIPVTQDDLSGWVRSVGRGMGIAGMRRGDVVLQAFGMSRSFGGGLPLVQVLHGNGMSVLPIGAETGAQRLVAAVEHLQPTVAIGTPHFLMHVAAAAEDVLGRALSEGSVRTLFVGGEPGGEALKPRLSELWGADVREALGASEVQPGMWVECGRAEGMHFHAHDTVLVEVLSADGQPLPIETGVTGELVCTDLTRRGLRLLRYQLGDVVEVVGTECMCGLTTPRVRVVGRSDDMLIVRGVNVYPAAVQRAVAELHPSVSGNVEIVWTELGHSTQRPLAVRVESAESDSDAHEVLRARVEAAIRDRCSCRAEVELVDPGTLGTTDSTKVRLVQREQNDKSKVE